MYDKFAEDIDSFDINDVQTTESISITSEGTKKLGNVPKMRSGPEARTRKAETSDELMRASIGRGIAERKWRSN